MNIPFKLSSQQVEVLRRIIGFAGHKDRHKSTFNKQRQNIPHAILKQICEREAPNDTIESILCTFESLGILESIVFTDGKPTNLYVITEVGFGYLATHNITPVAPPYVDGWKTFETSKKAMIRNIELGKHDESINRLDADAHAFFECLADRLGDFVPFDTIRDECNLSEMSDAALDQRLRRSLAGIAEYYSLQSSRERRRARLKKISDFSNL